jgi:DNA polymerase I
MKLPKVCQILRRYVAFDFEWDNVTHVMLGASFINNLGSRKVYLNSHSEIALLENIIAELLEYDWSIGWNSSTSIENNENSSYEDDLGNAANSCHITDVRCDLGILYERCKANGIDNIIFKSKKGSRTYYYIPGLHHIDLYQVYSKIMVQDTVYNRAYRTHKLEDVSKALLGHGKYKGLAGKDFLKLSIKVQKKYSLRDSELVMELTKYNNFEVLDAMLAISEITGLDFERVCRTNLTTWWGSLFDQMIETGECPKSSINTFDGENIKYKGALVLEPKQGLFHNIVVVDAASLYPTMGILYNLSFDTINCKCCKNNPNAKVKLNNIFFNGCKFISNNKCWICQKRVGAFPRKLRIFRRERFQQKKLGNKAKQLALKILINGGYGVFGHEKFSYYNPMIAELVTTYGRYTLTKMQNIAKRLGFQIIYGDTDSLFLNKPPSKNSLNKFQKLCKEQLDIEIEVKNTYSTLILSSGKKHYIGYENGVIDIVGYGGKKSDRCDFVKGKFNDVVTSVVKNNTNPIPNLVKAMSALESGKVNPRLLKKSIRLGQNPKDYVSQTSQAAKIGKAVGARRGELVEYFDSNIKKTGRSWSKDYRHIDISRYKQTLWNSVSEILEIAGYPIEELAKKFGVKIINRKNKNGRVMQNLPAVRLGHANLHQTSIE